MGNDIPKKKHRPISHIITYMLYAMGALWILGGVVFVYLANLMVAKHGYVGVATANFTFGILTVLGAIVMDGTYEVTGNESSS